MLLLQEENTYCYFIAQRITCCYPDMHSLRETLWGMLPEFPCMRLIYVATYYCTEKYAISGHGGYLDTRSSAYLM